MINEIKIMLGERASNYSDELISLCYKRALAEVQDYTKREDISEKLEMLADDIAILKLNRIGTEGISSESYSGVSESFIDGYPTDIQKRLDKLRQIKMF